MASYLEKENFEGRKTMGTNSWSVELLTEGV